MIANYTKEILKNSEFRKDKGDYEITRKFKPERKCTILPSTMGGKGTGMKSEKLTKESWKQELACFKKLLEI